MEITYILLTVFVISAASIFFVYKSKKNKKEKREKKKLIKDDIYPLY